MLKLRISVTDKCNLRCIYCKPQIYQKKTKKALLSFEEIYNISKFFSLNFSLNTIKITGGEPLLRKQLYKLVKILNKLKKNGLKRISITTNGTFLKENIYSLKESGLDDINISLDTLKKEKYKKLTGGNLDNVKEGLRICLNLNFPVKINCVLIKGINEDEIIDILKYSFEIGVFVRFIEFMPFKSSLLWDDKIVVKENDILKIASSLDNFEKIEDNGFVLKYFSKKGYRFGIIPSISKPFCSNCNRLRITSDGYLIPCIKENKKIYIKDLFKNKSLIEKILCSKKWNSEKSYDQRNEMFYIGG